MPPEPNALPTRAADCLKVCYALHERAPFGEPLYIYVGDPDDGQKHAVGPLLAAEIGVFVVEETHVALDQF